MLVSQLYWWHAHYLTLMHMIHTWHRIRTGLYLKLTHVLLEQLIMSFVSEEHRSSFFEKSIYLWEIIYFCFSYKKTTLLLSSPQASDTVSVSSNTERLVQVSKSPKQHLPSGAQALIMWAGEHGYSPVTSYTGTPVANHFNIRLREPGKLKRHPLHSPLRSNESVAVRKIVFSYTVLLKHHAQDLHLSSCYNCFLD